MFSITPANETINKTIDNLWHQNYTSRFFTLLQTYNVKFLISGHLMKADLRAYYNSIFFQAPAVSPDKSTNPAFSILELSIDQSDNKTSLDIDEISLHYL